MRSGLLNERILVYMQHTYFDNHGAVVSELEPIGSYWCRVIHANLDRSESDVERVVYNPNIRFELRASVPIAVNNIIEYDDIKYVITMIDKNKNRDIQTIYVERYE